MLKNVFKKIIERILHLWVGQLKKIHFTLRPTSEQAQKVPNIGQQPRIHQADAIEKTARVTVSKD